MSKTLRMSTMRPFPHLTISISAIEKVLPVGAMPANSPVWVPVHLRRR
jgi:hypothetical protein